MAAKKKTAATAPASILKGVQALENDAERIVARLKSAVESGASKASRRLTTARKRKRGFGRKKSTLAKRIGRLRDQVRAHNVAANRRALEAAETERRQLLSDISVIDKEIALMREESAVLKEMLGEHQAVGKATQKARRDLARRKAKKARRKRS
jgi:chromosome segregation ATPase